MGATALRACSSSRRVAGGRLGLGCPAGEERSAVKVEGRGAGTMAFGPTRRPDAPRGGALSKRAEGVLAGLLAETTLTRRQQQNILKEATADGTLPRAKEAANQGRLKRPAKVQRRPVMPMFPPTDIRTGKKTAAAIHAEHPPMERDLFVGAAPGRDNEREKDRLARRHEFAHLSKEEHAREEAQRDALSRSAPARRAVKAAQPAAPAPSKEAMEDALTDSILAEIEERKAFLEEARAAGRAGQYEAEIKAQIADRVVQLRRLGQLANERVARLQAEATSG